MRRRGANRANLAVALTAVAGLVLVAACSSAGDQASGSPTTEAGHTSSTQATTSTTEAPQPITIAFGGDVNFEGGVDGRLGPITQVLRGADLAVVNLETAIATGGDRAGKQFAFRAPPSALDALHAAGIDVASLANNHGLDYGAAGLQETLAAEQASGFPLIGVGQDEDEAFAPYTARIKGQRVAVIGATQVLDDNLVHAWTATDTHPGLASAKRVARLVEEVERARAGADLVIVYLHWGIETHTCPSDIQKELAETLVDAGADMVVGGHAHRLQGGGKLGDAMVHYGLGNFAFQANSADGARSGVLLVTATGRRIDSYQWVPAQIRDSAPYPLTGAAAQSALEHWNGLRGCTDLTA